MASLKREKMKIEVKRLYRKPAYTVGKMYVDGAYVCDTLEDADRGLSSAMPADEIARRKVYGKTAIPTGEYEVTLAVTSPKFGQMPFYKEVCGGKLPRFIGVPGFIGVLIHAGRTANNTDGCVLVGYNRVVGQLLEGKEAFRKLWDIVKEAKRLTVKVG